MRGIKKKWTDLPFTYLLVEFRKSIKPEKPFAIAFPFSAPFFALDFGSIFVNYSHRVDCVHHNLFCFNGRPILFHPFKSIANSGCDSTRGKLSTRTSTHTHTQTHTKITIRNVLSLMFVENQRHQKSKIIRIERVLDLSQCFAYTWNVFRQWKTATNRRTRIQTLQVERRGAKKKASEH